MMALKNKNQRGSGTLLMAFSVAAAMLVGFVYVAQRAVKGREGERRQQKSSRNRLVAKSEIGKVSEFFESGELILDCARPTQPKISVNPNFGQLQLSSVFNSATNSFTFSSCSPGSLTESTRALVYGANPVVPASGCASVSSTVAIRAIDCNAHTVDVEARTTDYDGSRATLRARLKLIRYDQPCPYFQTGTPQADPDNPANMIVFPQYFNPWSGNAHNPVNYMFWGKLYSSSPFGVIASHSNRTVNPNYVAPNGLPYYRIQQVYFQRPGEPVTFDQYSLHQAGFATEVLIGPRTSETCNVSQTIISEWYWGGCLDAKTRVLLSDGREVSIRDLKPGDAVRNPMTGETVPIASVLKPENDVPRLKIVAGGAVLIVTKHHPVKRKNEIVLAEDLRLNDEILTADGVWLRVEQIETDSKRRREMLNIRLKTDRYDESAYLFSANGFVVGDLTLQRRMGGADPREGFANIRPVLEAEPMNIEWMP